MKLFYKKILFFFLALSLILFFIWYSNILIKPALPNKLEEIESISVNSSMCLSIDFDALDENGLLYYVGSEDFNETYLELQTLIQILPNLKNIYIGLKPEHFFFEHKNSLFDPRRQKYYYMVPTDKILKNDLFNTITSRINPTDKFIFSIKKLLNLDYWKKEQHNKVLDSITFYNRIKEFKKRSRNQNKIINNEIKNLKRILDYLEQNNKNVIVFIPPYYKVFNDYYLNNKYNKTSNILNNLKLKNKFTLIDGTKMTEISNDISNYSDPIHLNLKGAKIFSNEIKKIIK